MSHTIKTLEGFTRKIRAVLPAADEVLLYRGHADRRNFTLLPSVMREMKFQDAEDTILRDLVASHPSEFATDTCALDQLARVQRSPTTPNLVIGPARYGILVQASGRRYHRRISVRTSYLSFITRPDNWRLLTSFIAAGSRSILRCPISTQT
jgi:hypothetical protein